MNRVSLALASLLVLAGCSDHTEGVPAATVAPATAPAAAAPTAPTTARQSLTIDRASSRVEFTGAKITQSHDGSFSDFSGTIELDPANLTQSSVDVQIQMASLHIEPERLAQHLVTPDFFDVAQFPTSRFRSTAITAGSDQRVGDVAATHTVTGELTLHGETRQLTFPAAIEVTDGAVRARSELTINRRDFGIVYPGMPDDLIRDEVVIRFDVRAPRS